MARVGAGHGHDGRAWSLACIRSEDGERAATHGIDWASIEFERRSIRIEDDVLVTKTGHEVLTHAVPKAVDEIEALMAR